VGHGERRRELERRFPGWEIWYVPREPDGATWRARPRMLIGAEDPGRGIPGHRRFGAAGLRAGLPGAGAAARRAGGSGRVRVAAGEGPPNAPGAAPGFPAEGSARPDLSTLAPSAAATPRASGLARRVPQRAYERRLDGEAKVSPGDAAALPGYSAIGQEAAAVAGGGRMAAWSGTATATGARLLLAPSRRQYC
jgi:hypothetical protein